MAFSDFTYPDMLPLLGLTERNEPDLFAGVPLAAVSSSFRDRMKNSVRLGATAHSEASRSTWIVGPVLEELWSRYNGRINMFAGIEFSADPDHGLNGYVDFLIGRAPQFSHIKAPVIVIVEAKRDSIPDGLGQCIAGMEGAMRFNRRHGTPVDTVYGAVTTGSAWKFMRLDGSVVVIDLTEYTIEQVDKLLGIFMHMIGSAAEVAAA